MRVFEFTTLQFMILTIGHSTLQILQIKVQVGALAELVRGKTYTPSIYRVNWRLD